VHNQEKEEQKAKVDAELEGINQIRKSLAKDIVDFVKNDKDAVEVAKLLREKMQVEVPYATGWVGRAVADALNMVKEGIKDFGTDILNTPAIKKALNAFGIKVDNYETKGVGPKKVETPTEKAINEAKNLYNP